MLKSVESRANYKGSVLERLIRMKMRQMTLVSLEDLVNADHQYRRFKEIFDFGGVSLILKGIKSRANYKDYGVG